ncbi:hypothetical protein B7486_45605 [cyanobacterium TDX16]|nr:hypothetical protein B7486_45605 [cyanobacterium TDX16]
MSDRSPSEASIFLSYLRNGIWFLGISFWLFGIIDRSIASFSDGSLSSVDTLQLFTAAFFFIAWLFLKPKSGHREKQEVGNPNPSSASSVPPAIF